MAAFAAAVKIVHLLICGAGICKCISIFISQNRGAGKEKRVQKGVRSAVTVSAAFCICVSVLIYFGARYLMLAFIDGSEHEIIRVGIQYLHIEGAFYCGIGILFLWYGYYRAVRKTGDVGGADGDLAWNESAAFLYTGTDKVDWSDCNLVVNSDWMVPGRRDRICLFAIIE